MHHGLKCALSFCCDRPGRGSGFTPPSWPPVNRSPGTVLTQDKLLTELSLLLLGRSSSKGWERQTDRQTDRHWHYRQWRNEFRQRQADCQTMWQNRWQTGCQTDNESMKKLASEKTDRLPNRHGQECSEDVPEISLVHQTWSGMFRRCARNLLCPPDMVRNVPKMCQKSPMFCKHSWWKHEMFFECRQECFWSSQSCQESSAVFSGCHLSSLGPQTRIPRTFFRGWHTCSLGSQTRMPGTFLSSYKFSVLYCTTQHTVCTSSSISGTNLKIRMLVLNSKD